MILQRPCRQKQKKMMTDVTLNIKLIDRQHINLKLTVPLSTPVYSIKKAILNHIGGGSTESIVVCKDSFEAKNELHNDNATLKEYGIQGNTTIYFKFNVKDTSIADPILMC